jgi:hypothetical protein
MTESRYAWSRFQNAPTASTLPIPSVAMMSNAAPHPQDQTPVQMKEPTADAEVDLRQTVASKLRNAVMEGDVDKLREAISEAEDAGLVHEASLGRKKLATLE